MILKKIFFILLFLCLHNNAFSQKGTNQKEKSSKAQIKDAAIVQVNVSGTENNYKFSVTISSPDKGCKQYANWWEIITEDGKLLYRRILAHSHITEQPFTRSSTNHIPIKANQMIYIRGHMNNTGYGTSVYKGSIINSFSKFNLPSDFAKNLEKKAPQPNKCRS